MKQRLRSFAVALMLAVMPVCSANATPQKLTVMLDWFINPDHAPLYVAQEKGFFANEGLDVTFQEPADPNDPPKLVAAGKADLALSYQPQLHLQVAEGLPLRRVATLIGTPLNSLIVLKDGPIKSIADLKGRKIGYSVGGFEEALLDAMLKTAGLSAKDVTLINVNFSLSPSVLSGQVDAVIGAYRNFELNQMDIEGKPGRAFMVEEYGVPIYDELILVAHQKNLGDARIAGFVRALERANHYLLNHPKESWDLFIKGRPKLDDELNRRAWKDTLGRFSTSPAAVDQHRYEAFSQFLVTQKLIPAPQTASDLALEVKR